MCRISQAIKKRKDSQPHFRLNETRLLQKNLGEKKVMRVFKRPFLQNSLTNTRRNLNLRGKDFKIVKILAPKTLPKTFQMQNCISKTTRETEAELIRKVVKHAGVVPCDKPPTRGFLNRHR